MKQTIHVTMGGECRMMNYDNGEGRGARAASKNNNNMASNNMTMMTLGAAARGQQQQGLGIVAPSTFNNLSYLCQVAAPVAAAAAGGGAGRHGRQ